jgi:glutamate/tyrosine decarboxylase-like PLP-dependent enzyme
MTLSSGMDPHQLLNDAHQRALRYLDQLPTRRVGPTSAEIAQLAELTAGPLPEHGEDAAQLLAALDQAGSPATVATAGPRYFGFVNGGTLPATLAAHWLAAAWDQNGAMHAMSPTAVELERAAHRWLIELFGLPANCGAGTTTGAQMANLTAMAAGRHAQLARVGWDVESHGLAGAPPVKVVISEQTHSTIEKAATILGLGRDHLIRVPADAQGRFTKLPQLDGPTIVCLQAGNVNTGAFDDFAPLIVQAHAQDAWVHIDGAFGLWAACSPRYAHLMHGSADADSWATDGHKTLNLPYDCGFVFLRDAAAHRAAMALGGAYITTESQPLAEPLWQSPDASRRARGIEAWMGLRSLGRAGVTQLVERLCSRAQYFARQLQAAGITVLNDVVFNQVLVTFGSTERTRAVISAIQLDGTCWCGGTVWQGAAAMRISVSNWSTTEADIDLCVAAIVRLSRSTADPSL